MVTDNEAPPSVALVASDVDATDSSFFKRDAQLPIAFRGLFSVLLNKKGYCCLLMMETLFKIRYLCGVSGFCCVMLFCECVSAANFLFGTLK